MLDRIKQDVVKVVLTVQVRTQEDVQAVEEAPAGHQRQVPARRLRRGARRGAGRRRRRRGARRRSCAPAGRSAATIRAPAARARNTSSATAALWREALRAPTLALDRCGRVDAAAAVESGRRCRSTLTMPVHYTPPTPDAAAAGAGRHARHRRRRRSRTGSATTCSSSRSTPARVAAGVFTQNRFCAAPVIVCRRHLAGDGPHSRARRQRRQRQRRHRRRRHRGAPRPPAPPSRRCSAARAREVLPFSTGVIMEPLPVEQDRRRAARGARRARAPIGWFAAASAIMTTDTVPKGASRRIAIDGVPVTVTGIAKGAGMIHPDMATMLVVHRHRRADRRGAARDARRARSPTPRSTARPSTATRRPTTASSSPPPARRAMRADRARRRSAPRRRCARALEAVAIELAQAIVRDGEGATKFITIARRRRARRRRMPARRVRDRAFAARQDGVLRVRPQSRPHRLRDRQRGARRPRSGARVVLARRRAGRRPRRPRARRYTRGGRPARDEAGRDHAFACDSAAATRRRPSGPATSRTTTSAINADYRS